MNTNTDGAFRQKKVYFSQISNHVIRDNELSLKAKGLYSLIQSYITIEDFILYKNTLKRQCKEGETSFENAWKELKVRGYLVQYRYRGKSGSFYYEYDLLDNIHTVVSGGVDNQDVGNAPSGEGGIYSNTDLTNTLLSNTEKGILRYTVLSSSEYVCYINIYKNAYKQKFHKLHMKVTIENNDLIDVWLKELDGVAVDAEEFKIEVDDYFYNLPKSNNGNMIAFMKASSRIFQVDSPLITYK